MNLFQGSNGETDIENRPMDMGAAEEGEDEIYGESNMEIYNTIYKMEYYSAVKRNTFESVLVKQMNLEPVIQSEVSQKEKNKYRILTFTYGIQKNGADEFTCRVASNRDST